MFAQMKAIEDENRRLKKMFAEMSMQNELLKEGHCQSKILEAGTGPI